MDYKKMLSGRDDKLTNSSEPPSLARIQSGASGGASGGVTSTHHTNIKGIMKELDIVTGQVSILNNQKRKLDKHKKKLENHILEWLKNANKLEVIYGDNVYFIDYKEKRKTIQKKQEKQEKRNETIQTLRNSGVDDMTLKSMFDKGLDFKFQNSVECSEQLRVRKIKS